MAEKSAFQIVEEATDDPIPFPRKPLIDVSAAATQALLLGLKALSQRALIAIDNLFTLVTVCLVFWLWQSIPAPNTYQIVSQAIFALFVLAANVIVRRK